jgi:hypothetical protein
MTDTITTTHDAGALAENLILKGDISKLSGSERAAYYVQVCASLGLNPLTQPLRYLELDGKLVLYATKDCTEQLRRLNAVSVAIVRRESVNGVYIVTARATTPDGRSDEATGAVAIEKEGGDWKTANSGKRYFAGNGEWIPLRGDALANALMKAETKAKRRVTLSICGLGVLDETELETIPGATPYVERTAPARLAAPQVDYMTSEQYTKINTLGKQLYSSEWGELARDFVKSITGGRTVKATEMTVDEAENLFDYLLRTANPAPEEQTA